MLFRAIGRPDIDLRWNLLFTILLTLLVVLGTTWGILGVAMAVAITHLSLQPFYLLQGRRSLRRLQHTDMVLSP